MAEDDKTAYQAKGHIVGAVGDGATAHFHGLSREEVGDLIRQVVTDLLPRLIQAVRDADPAHLPETIARDPAGGAVVGGTPVSPLQAEALTSLAHNPPPGTPEDVRHTIGAVAQVVSKDLAPRADFMRRAREYAEHGDLRRAAEEEPVYIPLELRFRRS